MAYRINADQITTHYTSTLAEFTANLKYEDIPPEVRERAKLIAMQTIGAALATKGTPIGDRAVRIGRMDGAGEPTATLWTDGSKVSMVSAAFTAGTIADALDWEDCSWTGHPSAGIVPTAFIAAEANRLSGKEFIAAIVAGYEVSQRVAMVVQPPADWNTINGWGLTSWQIFAALVPAAKLLGLTAEQIEQAFGFGCLCCPPQSNLHHITMSDAYHFEHGFRAKDGILCALTAKAGVDNYTGCFDDTYSWDYHMCSDPQRSWYVKDLGTRWLTMETLLKHWPANMWIQTPLELADILRTKHGIRAEDIEEIIIDPPTGNRMHYDPNGYTSLVQAQFSMPFMLAAYFLDPNPGKQWFRKELLTDPKVLELAGRVHGGPSEPHNLGLCFKEFQQGGFPVKTMTIRTRDGRTLQETMDCHPGHPRNMMTLDQICERFRTQASATLQGEKLERAAAAFANIENCGDLSELSEYLYETEE